MDKWSLLSRLRNAVKKLSFLLHLNVNRWRIASMIGRTASGNHRLKSFNDRPGLTAACADDETSSEDSGSSRGHLQRTISYSSDQDDIDQRAEMFIANFRRQLQMERQISLELRYCRGNSFDLKSPWSVLIGDDGASLWYFFFKMVNLHRKSEDPRRVLFCFLLFLTLPFSFGFFFGLVEPFSFGFVRLCLIADMTNCQHFFLYLGMLNFPLCKCYSLNFGEIFQVILLGKMLWDCFGKCHFLLAGFVMPNIN